MGRPRSRTIFQRLLTLTRPTLYRLLAEVLDTQGEYIEGLNRQQLREGERADGSQITPYYQPSTIKYKKNKGQPTDRVTLRDTGDFYDSIFTEVFSDAFSLESNDTKADHLRDKYGPVLGLNADSKQQLINRVRPLYVAAIRNHLQV